MHRCGDEMRQTSRRSSDGLAPLLVPLQHRVKFNWESISRSERAQGSSDVLLM